MQLKITKKKFKTTSYIYSVATEPDSTTKEKPMLLCDFMKKWEAYYFIRGIVTYRYIAAGEISWSDYNRVNKSLATAFSSSEKINIVEV